MLHEAAVVSQFADAMAEKGIVVEPGDIIADGKLHRIHVRGDGARTVKNGWYVLHNDDRPAGSFGCNKRYGTDASFSWSSTEKAAPMSAEERRAFRARMEAAAEQKAAEQRARHAAAGELANRIWDAGQTIEGAAHPYLERKGIQSHGLKVGAWEKVNPSTGELSVIAKNALLVPIRDARKAIHSLQAILPDASNVLGRDKDYLKDGDKAGRFFSIGKPVSVNGRPVILICEGYATGASLHEVTGHAVIVAFDAPNLLPVAKVIRDRFADATIVIAADNDQWTLTPVLNPGVTRANEAAAAIGARVAFPPFDDSEGVENEQGKKRGPTDFNDLAVLRGPEAVRLVIENALIDEAIVDELPQEFPAALETLLTGGHTGDYADEGDDEPPVDMGARKSINDIRAEMADNPHFRVLGYNREMYFVYRKAHKHIRALSSRDLNESQFHQIADPSWWEMYFPAMGKNEKGFNKTAAVAWFMQATAAAGIYDDSRVRGRGAWIDEGRVVYHHGKRLTVDGESVDVAAVKSEYVYESTIALPLPADEALSDEDGAKIVQLAQKFRWSKPGSAALVAGFAMLAPLCGALKWRPHIWLTGGAGCGKSTVLNKFVHPLMNGTDVFANGNSSEAGVRQRLSADARPVLFDESESNEEADARRIQNVLSMIRQASTESEAQTFKGTAGGQSMSFHVRSMFCLASIQVTLKHQADIERLTVLSLRPKREDPNAADNWKALQDELYMLERDTTIGARLLRRGLDLLPKIQQSIEVFANVAAHKFGTQREGDQYGTLLAGAWSLVSREVVTREEAEALIDSFDWSEHRDGGESDESERALSALMEAKLSHLGASYSVYELVHEAAGREGGVGIGQRTAEQLLGRAGMKVRGEDELLMSNASQQLKKLMEGTPFAADLRGLLLRLPGASRNGHTPVRFNGVQSRCIVVPLGPILNDLELTEEQL